MVVADAKSVCSWRKIFEAVPSFYVDSRACVQVGNDVSKWIPVNVRLRQGCVMSPWMFNVYVDALLRKVNVWGVGKGLELLSANGGRFEVNQLLFADDTAQVTDFEEKLCRLVSVCGRICERRKLRVNVGNNLKQVFIYIYLNIFYNKYIYDNEILNAHW